MPCFRLQYDLAVDLFIGYSKISPTGRSFVSHRGTAGSEPQVSGLVLFAAFLQSQWQIHLLN